MTRATVPWTVGRGRDCGLARYQEQQRFDPLPFRDSSLNVHLHRSGTPSRTLVIFVHGLSGSGYGTWGSLPAALFEGASLQTDVGVFDYVSGFRRLTVLTSSSMHEIAQELADEFRGLPHKNIVLLGHSMGGLVCQAAVQHSYEAETTPFPSTRKVIGLGVFGSPRAGTLLWPRIAPFGKDARFLRLHSEDQTSLSRFFATQVETRLDAHPTTPLWIPVFAAIASRDLFVDQFSSTHGIPAPQVRRFRGTHTSIVKPRDHGAPVVAWLQAIIDMIFTARLDRSRPRAIHGPGQIVSRFRGHPLRSDWEVAYRKACRLVAAEEGVEVVDERAWGASVEPTLVLRVVRAHEVGDEPVRSHLLEDGRAQLAAAGRQALGVSPNGEACKEAAEFVHQLIGDGQSRWVTGTRTLDELQDVMISWLRLASTYLGRLSMYSERSDLRAEATIVGATPRNLPETRVSRVELFGGGYE